MRKNRGERVNRPSEDGASDELEDGSGHIFDEDGQAFGEVPLDIHDMEDGDAQLEHTSGLVASRDPAPLRSALQSITTTLPIAL